MQMELTADFGYIRLHGPTGRYGGSYSEEELVEWAERIGSAMESLKSMFVYFNNDFEGYAVKNARKLIEMI